MKKRNKNDMAFFALLKAGLLKEERFEKFEKLLELSEEYKRVNQYA